MKMNGEKIINASKQDVWDALNNPEKLKLAIPGAESVEKKDEKVIESYLGRGSKLKETN